MAWRVIDGCPAPAWIAPYIYIVLRDAGMIAASIYRGEDAASILHRHGKHTQAEIHRMYPSISNPAGRSQHELRSDGYANLGPAGRHLHWWQVGIDAGDNSAASKVRVVNAAQRHGWSVRHPYTRGVEGHHFCFAAPPKPHSARTRARVVYWHARLPWR